MQTSTIQSEPTTPSLDTRFSVVRSFLKERGVVNYFSAFAAVNVQFTEDEQARIRQWWNKRVNIDAEDASIIESMERVVEHLKTAA